MQLKHLSVVGFKNIDEAEVEPAAGLTCLVGPNGAGKTNLLDALYLLSMCKSSVGLTDRQCIGYGRDFFLLKGAYQAWGGSELVSCGCSRAEGKVLKRNGKPYERLADHIGLLPLVMVSPADSALISEAGEERRRYLNSVAAQLDKGYLHAAVRYEKVLGQRNKMLKDTYALNRELLEVLDAQLGELAAQIFAARRALVGELSPIFERYYERIAGADERPGLRYASDLAEAPLADLLRRHFERDRALQFTSVGTHRDDLALTLGGHPLKKRGSQGQQKTTLLALKLAQAELLRQRLGAPPLLLLDDIFDKLDMGRVKKLVEVVSGGDFGQIFLTDSSKARLNELLHVARLPYKVLEVKGGAFTEL
ncbi:MAG: DNA replication/repair protein RecF [Prevotellaceae bacterium]|jgi:DNA replication and repair protein RecF|nr:DNA replication/repair protein RecF [Prevotellaceae bacterium]